MATTSPDSLWSPDSSDNVDQLHSDLATMQGSVQDALGSRQLHTYRWANSAARTAQTGMVSGDQGYQVDSGTWYRYTGSDWDSGDTGWSNLTLTNSWTVYSGRTPRYRRINGIVYLQGAATGGTTGAMATLPAGFRPGISEIQQAVPIGASTVTRVVITDAGAINVVSGSIQELSAVAPFPAEA